MLWVYIIGGAVLLLVAVEMFRSWRADVYLRRRYPEFMAFAKQRRREAREHAKKSQKRFKL